MTIYSVMYKDNSYDGVGTVVLSVFDDADKAYRFCRHVWKLKNNFKDLKGSNCFVEERKLNQECEDWELDFLG